MLYFSIALVIITLITVKFPPKFTFIKEIHGIKPPIPPPSTEMPDNSDINEDRPPTLDDLLVALNENLHGIMGGDEIDQ